MNGTATASGSPALLFTAFEPSGDDHAAPVIAELKRRHPRLPIYAWGGRKMEAAGATIIERTGEDAVIGVPGLAKIIEHGKINRRVDDWLEDNRITLHVPVDSPAANFPLCALSKARGVRVVHLVAPQLWAWGPWRIGKLRRLTDLVLCLLPFEEHWFLSRGVPAKFVGHPLFDHPIDEAQIDRRLGELVAAGKMPDGSPKIVMMPGSRPTELHRTLFPLLDAFKRLKADFPKAAGVFAVTKPEVEADLRRRAEGLGGWSPDLSVVAGDSDAAIRWADYALVKSGTVTLHVARQHKPMITFYRPNKLVYHTIARWIVSTPVFTLPNLIAGKRIVPELIPHFGDGQALAVGVYRLMRQPGFADDQRAALAEMLRKFDGLPGPDGVAAPLKASILAADAIEEMAGLVSPREKQATGAWYAPASAS